MNWALLDSDNKVVNLIAYDGVAPYTPVPGLTLALVLSTYQIGDTYVP